MLTSKKTIDRRPWARGLDRSPVPATIAIVGERQAESRHLPRRWSATTRKSVQCSAIWFANNLDCYDASGQAIPARRSVQQSRQHAVGWLQALFRQEDAHRKTFHGQLANRVMAQSATTSREKLSDRAFQKMFDRSIGCSCPAGVFIAGDPQG